MDINDIYKKVFPLGGIDDNNSYIDLTGDKICCCQMIEPALCVEEMTVFNGKDNYDKNNHIDKYGYRIPIISIDKLRINQIDIRYFVLDYKSFIPSLVFEFVDSSNSVLSTNVIKDGSIASVYIGGSGDELYYKPIRQDFLITKVQKIGGISDQNIGNYSAYRIYGKLNVPYGYRKESWCGGECSAMQALFNLCVYTGLGFSTNFTKSNSIDVMNWRNDEINTYFDFMQEITKHACYSPNTFFTSFIDQFNILNFVECHSLLSHGGKKTDIAAMIYNSFPPSEIPDYDPSKGEKTPENQLPLKEGDDKYNNSYQKLSYYFLSNNEHYNGWTNFIEEYTEINNCSSSLTDGYKRHICYSDSNSGDWGFSACEFTIRPLDNLKRDSSQKIEPLSEEPTQDSYIPLNLIHTTKSDYQNADVNDIDNITSTESYTSFGEVDTSNMFKQYFFSEVQNQYQMKCMKKCGLSVTLQNYNPSVTKFSRIWVDIYDKNMMSSSEISKATITEDEEKNQNNYTRYKKEKNKNILKFDDEGVIDEIDDEERKNKNWPRGEFNRALSGWYVVTEMEIFYSPKDNNLKMKLTLNRIEYQPCFKDEYTVAKKAIDKYKEENIIDELLINKEQ